MHAQAQSQLVELVSRELLELISREIAALPGVGAVPWGGAPVGESDVRAMLAVGADRVGGTPGLDRVPEDLAGYIDHTLLKPEATLPEVRKLCEEAARFGFVSVCINPVWVPVCREMLGGTGVRVCTVIGFPLGAVSPRVKAFEARAAVEDGAKEVDMVLNVGAFKSGFDDIVASDIQGVVAAASPGAVTKVILETALLGDEEKIRACELAKRAGAHFVKTSTGFGPGGATAADIALMRRIVGPAMGVKASGGVRTHEDALRMIRSGASRIGASASVRIMSPGDGAAEEQGY